MKSAICTAKIDLMLPGPLYTSSRFDNVSKRNEWKVYVQFVEKYGKFGSLTGEYCLEKNTDTVFMFITEIFSIL